MLALKKLRQTHFHAFINNLWPEALKYACAQGGSPVRQCPAWSSNPELGRRSWRRRLHHLTHASLAPAACADPYREISLELTSTLSSILWSKKWCTVWFHQIWVWATTSRSSAAYTSVSNSDANLASRTDRDIDTHHALCITAAAESKVTVTFPLCSSLSSWTPSAAEMKPAPGIVVGVITRSKPTGIWL